MRRWQIDWNDQNTLIFDVFAVFQTGCCKYLWTINNITNLGLINNIIIIDYYSI